MHLNGTSLSYLFGCALFAVFSCARLNVTGGGGTEWEAKITGRVVDSSGASCANVRVQLLPALYNPVMNPLPGDSLSGITDEAGYYLIATSQTGNFNVEAVQPATKDKALITGLSITSTGNTQVQDAVLRKTGKVIVLITDSLAATDVYVYFPGTTSSGQVHNGSATLNDVPAGLLPALAVSNSAAGTRVIRTNITIPSADTIVVEDHTGWSHSKKLYLNTTANGAAVAGAVTGFPALIRLTSGNFYFSQAKRDGSDLRFSKGGSDMPTLPFEIEHWDSANAQAEIWVKIDTVFGNDSTHFITMLWGNPGATSASNGAAVFDTANGFEGVWHLNEATGALSKDATCNHYDGTPSDTAPSSAAGAIGRAQEFNGVSSFFNMQGTANGKLNFPLDGVYSLSAWVYADTLDSSFYAIVAKGDYGYCLQIRGSNELEVYQYKNGYYEATIAAVSSRVWKYVVAIRAGLQQYIYVDGTLVSQTISDAYNGAARDTTKNVTIGTIEGVAQPRPPVWRGMLDEVRISNIACSPDWIRLCYMNQKADNALVKW